MKDRMKRLSILFMTATLCTGTLYAQCEPVNAEATQPDTYAESTVDAKVEAQSADNEKPAESDKEQTGENETQPETAQVQETESTAPETESQTEAQTDHAGSSDGESQAEATESQTSTGETQTGTAESHTSETDAAQEKAADSKTGESDTEETTREEEQEESDENLEELLVKDQAGNALKKEPFHLPKTLTAGTETYPVEYRQGVWKVTVPANCKTLQIIVPDQKENEELSFTKWGGYLTESDKHWYLCPDDPIQDAYTTQGNIYTIDLEKFTLSMEEITREQLAVYGDLAEDITYAEILLTGEGRSELLLVEFATEAMTEEDPEAETEAATEETTENLTEQEESAEIAALSASAGQVDTAYNAAGKNLSASAEKSTPTVGSINGDWQILGLARSGKLTDDVLNKYLANVISTLKENNGKLHDKRYTDYSRVVLALTSLGIDVTNVGGYNLLQPLSDYDQTVWQGVNGATWALIAFDSHDYEIPQAASGKTQNSRDKLIQNILDQEVSGGGWDLSGRSADPDVTAMAIQALAPYYSTNAQVKAAVDRGLNKLSAMQKSNGSYATYGSETSESCSQVIVALTAMGIDPNTDSRFVKNGKSVIDALLTYANADGSFKHVLKGDANQMATEQAYYALTAYERFTGGKTRLYDMTDVELPSDKEKAETTQKLITAIPDNVKLADKNQIEAAKAMYDSLTTVQKSLVTNYSKLEAAMKKLQELEKSSGSGSGSGSDSGSGSGNKTNTTKKKTKGSTKKVNLVSGSSGKKGGTAAGKTASGKTAADTKEKESEKETDKNATKTTEKKGGTKTEKEVTSLITEMNGLFRKTKTSEKLPENAEDYTDVQKEQILDIYRTYSELTDAQKKEVEESSHYQDYQKSVEGLKEVNHYDEAAGVDLRDNEEEILPWYVQVEASSLNVESSQAEQVSQALKGEGELLNLTDISLMDLLDNTEWEPDDLVRVSVPLADLGDYENVAVVHLKDDGSLEFIDGHIAGSRLEFDTDQFSRFGIAGYNGSMEDLMKPEESTQKPLWMYLIPGAGAAALLVILGAMRLSLSRKGKKKKGEERER